MLDILAAWRSVLFRDPFQCCNLTQYLGKVSSALMPKVYRSHSEIVHLVATVRFFDGSIDGFEQCLRQHASLPENEGADSEHSTSDLDPELKVVHRRHCSELSYETFVLEYMIPNKPVIIQVSNHDSEWLHVSQSGQEIIPITMTYEGTSNDI